MIRRRLVVEWNDEGTDTDEDCLRTLLSGDWTLQGLVECDQAEKALPEDHKPSYCMNLVMRVEDA